MKIAKTLVIMLASGATLPLWGESNHLPTTSVSAEAPAADGPHGTTEDDDELPNQPAALRDSFRPGMSGAALVEPAKRDGSGPVSVLCFKQPDEQALSETIEDLTVLSHLVSRNLEQGFTEDADNYAERFQKLTSGKQVAAAYIQGFGAILRIQVPFPVVAPPRGMEQVKDKRTGSEWERARQELLSEESAEMLPYWGARSRDYSRDQADGQAYDAKLVQRLQQRVLTLLTNACKLRHLEGGEWIIVKIVGAPSLPSVNQAPEVAPVDALPGKKQRRYLGGNFEPAAVASDQVPTSNRATIMTLRVKKSAADAFSSGTLSEDQFLRGAEVATYINPINESAIPRRMVYDLKSQPSVMK